MSKTPVQTNVVVSCTILEEYGRLLLNAGTNHESYFRSLNGGLHVVGCGRAEVVSLPLRFEYAYDRKWTRRMRISWEWCSGITLTLTGPPIGR